MAELGQGVIYGGPFTIEVKSDQSNNSALMLGEKEVGAQRLAQLQVSSHDESHVNITTMMIVMIVFSTNL